MAAVAHELTQERVDARSRCISPCSDGAKFKGGASDAASFAEDDMAPLEFSSNMSCSRRLRQRKRLLWAVRACSDTKIWMLGQLASLTHTKPILDMTQISHRMYGSFPTSFDRARDEGQLIFLHRDQL